MKMFQLTFVVLLAVTTDMAGASTPQECAFKFGQLRFAFSDFARYTDFFEESSTMTLANTGVYRGPDGIEEYG